MKFHIANMTCGGCVKGVTATLKKLDPAAAPQIDMDRKEVVFEGTQVAPAQVAKALADAGWQHDIPAAG